MAISFQTVDFPDFTPPEVALECKLATRLLLGAATTTLLPNRHGAQPDQGVRIARMRSIRVRPPWASRRATDPGSGDHES